MEHSPEKSICLSIFSTKDLNIHLVSGSSQRHEINVIQFIHCFRQSVAGSLSRTFQNSGVCFDMFWWFLMAFAWVFEGRHFFCFQTQSAAAEVDGPSQTVKHGSAAETASLSWEVQKNRRSFGCGLRSKDSKALGTTDGHSFCCIFLLSYFDLTNWSVSGCFRYPFNWRDQSQQNHWPQKLEARHRQKSWKTHKDAERVEPPNDVGAWQTQLRQASRAS